MTPLQGRGGQPSHFGHTVHGEAVTLDGTMAHGERFHLGGGGLAGAIAAELAGA